jgi:hypothetical protein
MVNIEDAIKVAGMEGKMTAIDLVELVDRHSVVPDPGPDATQTQRELAEV